MSTESLINSFLLGAAVGSIITYWIVTREKRLISRIRDNIHFLADLHELTPAQRRKAGPLLDFSEIATDKEILEFYRWGHELVKGKGPKGAEIDKLDPISIAAEGIIFDKLLELPRVLAVPVVLTMKRKGRADLDTWRSIIQTEVRFQRGRTDSKTSHQ
jgi:hypothetical protein